MRDTDKGNTLKRIKMKELKALNRLINNAENYANRINQMRYKNLQSIDSLSDWEIGEKRLLANTINEKIYEDNEVIVFRTTIPPNVFFDTHFHDVPEEMEVEKNEVVDKTIPGKVWKEGDKVFYPKYVAHMPGNKTLRETILKVTFYKNH